MIPIRNILSLIFVLVLTGLLKAQDSALVRFSDLKFFSRFEQDAFTEFREGKPDYFKLFLAASPGSDEKLYDSVTSKVIAWEKIIRGRNFGGLKDRKKVERVYKRVNEDVLGIYHEQTLFPEIFSTGNFNCLTASALYGFLFTRLGIDFEIRESSNHVHPVAYPGSLQIKVETTDPFFGFQYFDDKLKLQFVNYLISAKIISREEARNTPAEVIFNKYYFPETSIGLKELSGLQYLNDAFYLYGREEYLHAFRQIQKAFYLYPSGRVSTVMLFLLSRCIAESEYNSVSEAELIIYASRFSGRELEPEHIINEFANLTNKVLLVRSQTALYDSIFSFLSGNIKDPEVLKPVKMQYYYQKGRLFLSTFRVKDALTMFEMALELDPGNIEFQNYSVQSLAFSFNSASNQEIVNSIESFEGKFPGIKSNEGFITLQMLAYLQNSMEKFDFEKPDEGEAMLEKFESLFYSHPGMSIKYEKVGDAYSSAAVYYFKRNDINKARAYLNRGLEIAPENYQLMYRLRAL